MSYKLLSVGTNAKTIKGDGKKYKTAIIYMIPNEKICPMSGKNMANCRVGCLVNAGLASVYKTINQARQRRTDLYENDQKLFLEILNKEIKRFINYCEKRDITPCIRLNGTSDIDYERLIDMESYNAIFYDYTKRPNRLDKKLPKNYHLTVSYSQATERYQNIVEDAIKKHSNINVAVVFRDKLPAKYKGFKVINGDLHDLRFLDKKNVVVGLKEKLTLNSEGKLDRDNSGFVVDLK